MKPHTTNYFDTFIRVAEDCPVQQGQVPPLKDNKKTAASIQFEMIHKNPYKYTSDDVLFQVYACKNDLTRAQYKKEQEKFFSKGQPCLRASPLTKRYGWGIHSNAEGKIALYSVGSKEYEDFSKDKRLKVLKAMRSGR
ncbi:hypothetical protein A8C56_11750 [Niabella ginsenosidivorans]|uniref:Uncharacterized protein n=1 Tax=Niabella ginsenosidivorans TaxID=1176587 RepID=A0A1A9I1Q1_9BACT|nr:DUF6157 family protein [Niabella ginsenosidivorans]ANH81556.1 hypothetical protein A8C56_11750 [Niabella ginsenosidivorans]